MYSSHEAHKAQGIRWWAMSYFALEPASERPTKKHKWGNAEILTLTPPQRLTMASIKPPRPIGIWRRREPHGKGYCHCKTSTLFMGE